MLCEDVDVSPGTNAPSRIAKSVVPGFTPPSRTPSEEAIPGRRTSRPPSQGDPMTWKRHRWRHISSSTMLPSTPMGTNANTGAMPLQTMYRRGTACGHRIPAFPADERRMHIDSPTCSSQPIQGSESHLSRTPLGRRQSPMRGCRQGRPMTSLFRQRNVQPRRL